jgi:hypothetical protein
MKFNIKTVLNPFFSGAKSGGKGAAAAGMSALAVGAYAGSEHFLNELMPTLIGFAVPPPFGQIVALTMAGVATGGLGAIANFKKNHRITPEQLTALMDAARHADNKKSAVEVTKGRIALARLELEAAIEASKGL